MVVLNSLIDQIKCRWPDLHFTKENIQRPTPECLLQFYSRAIMNFHEMIAFVLVSFEDNYQADLGPEESIFLKMQTLNDVFQHASMRFLLGDIYEPVFIRTKHFIHLFLHFLKYFDDVCPSFENSASNIYKMREDFDKLVVEKSDKLDQITELANQKSQLLEDNEILQEKIKKAENEYEECRTKRAEKDKEIKRNANELERLEMAVGEKKLSLERLEAEHKRCTEESITEEEYLDLKNSEVNLKNEKDSLETEDEDLEDSLSHQYETINHFRKCGQAVPGAFNVDSANKQISMEVKLEEFEIKKEKLLSELSSHKAAQTDKKKIYEEAERYFSVASSRKQNILKAIQEEFEKLSQKVQNHKQNTSDGKKDAFSRNFEINSEIARIESDLERLRDHFRREYIKVAKAEEVAFKQFKENLKDLSLDDL